MTMADLLKYKDVHGLIKYRDKFGEPGEWVGYIREVNGNHCIFEDNEIPHRFKIHEVIDFTPIKLPSWKK